MREFDHLQVAQAAQRPRLQGGQAVRAEIQFCQFGEAPAEGAPPGDAMEAIVRKRDVAQPLERARGQDARAAERVVGQVESRQRPPERAQQLRVKRGDAVAREVEGGEAPGRVLEGVGFHREQRPRQAFRCEVLPLVADGE